MKIFTNVYCMLIALEQASYSRKVWCVNLEIQKAKKKQWKLVEKTWKSYYIINMYGDLVE